MAFPSSPSVGQRYEKWEWNGTGWVQAASGGGTLAWQSIVLVSTLSAVSFSVNWNSITYV